MKIELGFEVQLPQPYEQALESVTAALKAEGFGILTRIDVSATMQEKLGVDFRPFMILGACNPPLAHKALSHDPQVGLMMPCNVTVEALPDGSALVRLANPAGMAGFASDPGHPAMREIAAEGQAKIQRVVEALKNIRPA